MEDAAGSASSANTVQEARSSVADLAERSYALRLDAEDSLRHLRAHFWLPQKSSLKKRIVAPSPESQEDDAVIYLAGSGIGLQPRTIGPRVAAFLAGWASQGVFAAYATLADSPVPNWVDAELHAAALMARVVGAAPAEVAMMGSLSTNLHLLLGSFYRPDVARGRTQILMEQAAFCSDWFVAQSQVQWHGLAPDDALVGIQADPATLLLADEAVIAAIDAHADTAALLLLAAVDFRTGLLLDVPRITAHARARGIVVGWDLAHAAGNVLLRLHDWDVDFAVWCCNKFLNAGPGSTGGVFVHDRHGAVEAVQEGSGETRYQYKPRLEGWWGGRMPDRFKMENTFAPANGAAGFMVSSPSILDLTAVTASLQLFDEAGMPALCHKSRGLSSYLSQLLQAEILDQSPWNEPDKVPFWFITPRDLARRGAQCSLGWKDRNLLDTVAGELERHGILVDIKGPNIMRLTPVPLINTYVEIWETVGALKAALGEAKEP